MGICKEAIAFEPKRGKDVTMKLTFHCQPQMWSLDGQRKLILTRETTIKNPFEFHAKPILRVYGSGEGNVYIGDEVIQIHDAPQRTLDALKNLPGVMGTVTQESRWIKLSADDPRLDDTERALFSDEVYCCGHCGNKEYFGAGCKKGRYCQNCGARMVNARDRA